MPERDLVLLAEAAHRAGQIAMRFWGNSPRVTDKGGGQGPVTEADIAVNDMLADTLRTARPDYGWLSEESPNDPARLDCEHVFIIDPIDGTRAFVDADPGFSHSLAIARHGQVTAAVVYLPAQNRLFAATAQSAATRDAVAIKVSGRELAEDATLMTSRGNLDPEHWHGPPPRVQRLFRPSLANRLCLVADGTADALLTLRPTWEWDVAAGSLIATRAGAVVTDRRGKPAVFNQPTAQTDGLLVASPGLHRQLAESLKH